ncbi:MAG: SRPBCC domain-containing protein [Acidimicrobiia bacterium]|nr:SRPBCC domain-containing protein [Acidimicrobiia bacterium]
MTPDSQLGSIERHGNHTVLRFQRSLAHHPEKVWQALTESEHMKSWLPVDMIGVRSAGATVSMVFWPDLVEKKGLDPDAGTAVISEWDPPNVFEWVWHGSRVRFELTRGGEGCLLELTVEIESDDPDTIIDNAGGYHQWADHLTMLLDDGVSPSIADAEPQQREDQYRSLIETL